MTADLTPQFREDMAVLRDGLLALAGPQPEPLKLLVTEQDVADLCDQAGLRANVQDDGSIIYADDAIDVWAHADGIDFTDGRAGGTLDYGIPFAVLAEIVVAVRKAAQR